MLRGEVYAAVYRFRDRAVEALAAPALTALDALKARPAPVVAVGDGAALDREAIRAWTGRPPVLPPLGAQRAAALLMLDRDSSVLRPVDDPATFEPEYGRPAEAQVRWERAHGRQLPDAPGQTR
jgi:tRNA threonylcarbamoyladenosine biosynthesis protein TsaB